MVPPDALSDAYSYAVSLPAPGGIPLFTGSIILGQIHPEVVFVVASDFECSHANLSTY